MAHTHDLAKKILDALRDENVRFEEMVLSGEESGNQYFSQIEAINRILNEQRRERKPRRKDQ
jgi:hypothetical protein